MMQFMSRCTTLAWLLGLVSLMPSQARGGIVMAGTDTIGFSTGVFTIQVNHPFFPGGFTETVNMTSGAFSIVRQQQQGLGDGSAASYIDTEILGLTLTGTSINVGPMVVRIGSDNGVQQASTLGRVTNVVSSPIGLPVLVGPSDFVSGDSFFEVFFEVDVSGSTFYNRVPHTLSLSGINSLPPTGVHFPPNPPVALYLRTGAVNSLTDPIVGSASGIHSVPEPTSSCLLAAAFLVMASKKWLRILAFLSIRINNRALTSAYESWRKNIRESAHNLVSALNGSGR